MKKKKFIKLYIFIGLICCGIVIVYFSATMMNNEKMVNQYIQDELYYSSGKYANEFTILLQQHEDTVDAVATYAEMVFRDIYTEDGLRQYNEDWQELNTFMGKLIEKNDRMLSIYFTFNIEKISLNYEIWLGRNAEGKAAKIQTGIADASPEAFKIKFGEDYFDYYFNAIKNGKTWIDPFQDRLLKDELVTFSKAVYDGHGNLIGVAGADMSVSNILESVQKMKIHDSGQAMIFGKGGGYIAGTLGTNPKDINKITILNKKTNYENKVTRGSVEHGTISYVYQGEEYIGGFSALGNGWVLQVAVPKSKAIEPLENLKRLLTILGFFLITMTVLLVISISNWSLKPLMKEYEEIDIMVANQSRLAKLGEMVGNVAHQWKQPLNSIAINMANIEDDLKLNELDAAQFEQYRDNIELSIDSMAETLENFTGYLKPDREKTTFCINDAVKRALSLIDESIKVNRIAVIQEGESKLYAHGFFNEFTQSVFNIITNARDAIIKSNPEEKTIRIRYELSERNLKRKAMATLSIFNNGDTIPEKELGLIFKPYFTTKEDSGGTGLGLYISKQIIEDHMNGSLEIFNRNDGVCCRITLAAETNSAE